MSWFSNIPQILEAVSRKITLSPSVDLASVAQGTEGYSGADLQALLYNAHLDVIHETLAHVTERSKTTTSSGDDGAGHIQYTEIGASSSGSGRVMSKAEKDAFQRRVSYMMSISVSPLIELNHSSSALFLTHARISQTQNLLKLLLLMV